jgi:hypothetical protein
MRKERSRGEGESEKKKIGIFSTSSHVYRENKGNQALICW